MKLVKITINNNSTFLVRQVSDCHVSVPLNAQETCYVPALTALFVFRPGCDAPDAEEASTCHRASQKWDNALQGGKHLKCVLKKRNVGSQGVWSKSQVSISQGLIAHHPLMRENKRTFKAKVERRLWQQSLDEVRDVAFNPFHVATSGLLPENDWKCFDFFPSGTGATTTWVTLSWVVFRIWKMWK